jgi:hypothetical protein
MPVQIKVQDNAYQKKLVTLNGNSLFFTFSYDTRDARWYFDIFDRNNNDIVNGVKILPTLDLSSKYTTLATLIGGYLFCVDTRGSGEDVTRLNFGTDRQFQFWYYTDQEIEDIINESTV